MELVSDADAKTIVRGLEENLWSFWRRFGKAKRCSLHESESVTWFETPIPILPYNTVIRFCPDRDSERKIDEIFNHFQARGVPHCWIVHPSARPTNLEDLLRARGLENVEDVPGMALSLSDAPPLEPPPEGFSVAELQSPDDLDEFLDLAAWRWEVPEEFFPVMHDLAVPFEIGKPGSAVRLWVARRLGKGLAKVALNLSDGVAGIYAVATKEEARGLGLARGLCITALHAAREAGYETAVLHSTPMARSLYKAMGFREYAWFKVFAPPQSFHL